MASVVDLMQRLGIQPSGSSARAVTAASYRPARPAAPQFANRTSPIEIDFGALGRGMGVPPTGGKDWWDNVKGAFGQALDIVDTPGAFVRSAVKEGIDALQDSRLGQTALWRGTRSEEENQALRDENQFSFRELMDQGWDNKSSTENLVNDYNLFSAKDSKVGSAIGFGLDIVLDPTTYVGVGVAGRAARAAAGRGAVDAGLSAAVRHGGRNEIAKAVLATSKDLGIADDVAKRVATEAAQKGRGALTRGALRRAGANADEIEKLGADLRYTFGVGSARAAIPGSRLVAEGSASLKGTLKQTIGGSRAAKVGRTLRFTDELGERSFVDALRAAGKGAADLDTKFTALKGLASVNVARGRGHGWADQFRRTLDTNLAKASGDRSARNWLKRLTPQAGVDITHRLDVGDLSSPETKAVRDSLDQAHRDLVDAGVEVAYRQNYVPRFMTEEALDSADDRVIRYKESLAKTERFQAEQTLQAGDEFMGEVLQEGTIREINEISQRVLGHKFFEDDIALIMGSYMAAGAKSMVRQAQKNALRGMGVVTEKAATKVRQAADLSDVERAEIQAAERAARKTRDAASTELGAASKSSGDLARERRDRAGRALVARKKALETQASKLEEALAAFARRKADAESRVVALSNEIQALTGKREAMLSAVSSARGRQRARLQAKYGPEITKLGNVIADKQNALAAAQRKVQKIITNAQIPVGVRISASKGFVAESERLANEIGKIKTQVAELDGEIQATFMRETPAGAGTTTADEVIRQADNTVLGLTAELGEANNLANVADMNYKFAIADSNKVAQAVAAELGRVDDIMSKLDDLPRVPIVGSATTRYAKARAVRDMVDETLAMLSDVDLPDDVRRALAGLRAQEAIVDMRALRANRQINAMDEILSALEDRKFVDSFVYKTGAGMRSLDARYEIPEWVAKNIEVERVWQDPDALKMFISKVRSVRNWWKGWATARPGFVVRNMLGGMFNIYMEAGVGGLDSMFEWRKFYSMYAKNPEGYLDDALKTFKDPNKVRQMDEALQVVFGTGGGLTSTEYRALDHVTRGRKLNPFSAEFMVPSAVRAMSTEVEHLLRGGHAYDVLRRGGTMDLATDTVNKWHFNYRDITNADKVAKGVMPFWTFYSRNLALQAQTFTSVGGLAKLNRTVENARRNLEANGEPDTIVPGYFEDLGAIRIAGGGDQGSQYWFPDLPSSRFMDDIGKFTQPTRLLGDLGPELKVPLEYAADKQFFTGNNFRNSYSEFDGSPRSAPVWARVPGVSQLLTETFADGTPVMTDKTQVTAEGLWPALGTINRLWPTQERGLDNRGNSWLSFMGLSVRDLDDNVRDAEIARRQRALRAEQDRLRDLGY